MATITHCPNCNEEYKSGTFSSNKPKPYSFVRAIKAYTNLTADYYCDKCHREPMHQAITSRPGLIEENNKLIQSLIDIVPVVTLQNPQNWFYEPIKIVTAQSVTGEGALTEFSSSFSEFFGTESKRMNSKLKSGENSCFAQIRLEALKVGANAVIGLDIDYAEVGSLKGMLMVCMAGTAVNITNSDALNNIASPEKFEKLKAASKDYVTLNSFNSFLQPV